MADERVDKAWQKRGLSGYSTAAILATLKHYGVATDEQAFKQTSAEKFPLGIAEQWHGTWKGTGQFSRFHVSAAEELWKRLNPERLDPTSYAAAVADLLGALTDLLEGSAEAPVGIAFKKLDELKAKIPLDQGQPVRAFVAEMAMRLGDRLMQAFGQVAQKLAQEGHVDDAEEFARLEEMLFPEWAGISSALVRAAKGEKDAAVGDLEKLVQDSTRPLPSRAAAIDALLQLEQLKLVAQHSQPLIEEARKADDLHAAMELAQRRAHALEKLGDRAGLQEALATLEALDEQHAHAHPHHH